MKISFLIFAGAALAATAAAAAAQAAAQPSAQDSGAPAIASQPGSVPFVAPPAVREIVDRHLGARYGASDKEAVARCVTAALAEGAILYGVNGYAGTEGYAGYAGAYRPGEAGVPGFPGIATRMRVSAITAVQRRPEGMRVKGLIDSGVDYRGGYGGQAYQGAGAGGQPYATRHPSNNDLEFRCNLDTAGLVTGMHVERHTTTYRRF
jgi:hypothetical protein